MCDGRRRSNGRVQSGVSDVESVLAFCLLRDSMSVIMAGVTNTSAQQHAHVPTYMSYLQYNRHLCYVSTLKIRLMSRLKKQTGVFKLSLW